MTQKVPRTFLRNTAANHGALLRRKVRGTLV